MNIPNTRAVEAFIRWLRNGCDELEVLIERHREPDPEPTLSRSQVIEWQQAIARLERENRQLQTQVESLSALGTDKEAEAFEDVIDQLNRLDPQGEDGP